MEQKISTGLDPKLVRVYQAINRITEVAEQFIGFDGDVWKDPAYESFEDFAIGAEMLGDEIIAECAGYTIHFTGLGYHPVFVDGDYETMYGTATGFGELVKIEYITPDMLSDDTLISFEFEDDADKDFTFRILDDNYTEFSEAVPQDNFYRLVGHFMIGSGVRDEFLCGASIRGQKQFYRVVDLSSIVVSYIEQNNMLENTEDELDANFEMLKIIARDHNNYISHRKFRRKSIEQQLDEIAALIQMANEFLPLANKHVRYNTEIKYTPDNTSHDGLLKIENDGYCRGRILGISSLETVPISHGFELKAYKGNIGSKNTLCLAVINFDEGRIEYLPVKTDVDDSDDMQIINPFSSEY